MRLFTADIEPVHQWLCREAKETESSAFESRNCQRKDRREPHKDVGEENYSERGVDDELSVRRAKPECKQQRHYSSHSAPPYDNLLLPRDPALAANVHGECQRKHMKCPR
jgi:hypothetical protein